MFILVFIPWAYSPASSSWRRPAPVVGTLAGGTRTFTSISTRSHLRTRYQMCTCSRTRSESTFFSSSSHPRYSASPYAVSRSCTIPSLRLVYILFIHLFIFLLSLSFAHFLAPSCLSAPGYREPRCDEVTFYHTEGILCLRCLCYIIQQEQRIFVEISVWVCLAVFIISLIGPKKRRQQRG